MIELFPHQDDFLYSEARHTGLVAGFGSGKSFVGSLKTLAMKMRYPGIDVAYYLPTYPLIKDIAFPRFKEVLEMHNVPYVLNKSDKDFITPYGRIILRSMDNPDLIVGYEVGYSLIDEADILATNKMDNVFVKVVARNRKKLPDGRANNLDFVSTPEGFKFLYKFFVTNASDNRVLVKGKTSDNTHLPESFIETLMESYTDEQIEAYLNGEFVNMTSGTVYRNYDRDLNHSDREIQGTERLHIGMDFNITNMNAVIHILEAGKLIAVEEIVKAYDTQAIIEIIKDRFPKHPIVIYPDSAGKARSTSGKSDHRLLKEAGFVIKSLKSNPLVKDRVNAMNLSFFNRKGERRYKVNRHNCPTYAEALEQQVYKNGAPDKTGGFDHITEAGGYCVYQHTKQFKGFTPAKAR